MKKIIIISLAVLVTVMLALSAFGITGPGGDYQAIKKAVKENPSAVPDREAKFFRLRVTDNKTGKVDVEITMPVSVIDILSRCLDKDSLRIHERGCDLDLRELFNEIKAAGPTMFVEITEQDETVKIWLE